MEFFVKTPRFKVSVALFGAILLLLTLHCSPSGSTPEDLPLEQVKLPPGFEISIYAADVPNARSMTLLQSLRT